MNQWEKQFGVNQEYWNAKTKVHVGTKFYDVDGFRSGKSSLNPLELEDLGDVKGKTLLHLQCHFGLDTLSWAREGAIATGLDLSDESIATAKKLAEEVGTKAEFVWGNVYDAAEILKREFDIVFTSYGAVPWLPDLDKWAEVVVKCLKPGGTFYIAEFHPILNCFDDDFVGLELNYFHNKEPHVYEEEGTYADRESDLRGESFWWAHPLSEVFTALQNAGLTVERFRELPYSYYDCFPNFEAGEDGYFRWKEAKDVLPITYSLLAKKPV